MDNQHRKIAGYRELSQEEIGLMNAIKNQGAEMLRLQRQLHHRLTGTRELLLAASENPEHSAEYRQAAADELARFNGAEPLRWLAIGKTDIQTAVMALVRAVAQPADD
ncbi:MAG: hypothetical protein KAZ13_01590 [Desulfobulbus sp.]|nr:hypothetical protein [Desulfobulbus sp.]